MSGSDPLLVVDAPSLMYRAFHALPDSITDGEGHPVNALLGTTNILLLELERQPARAVVFCFGAEAATYRTQLYKPYHADRTDPPEPLDHQFAQAEWFFGAFGWGTLRDDTLEPDDLLGALASAEAGAGGSALILTGDRDMFQCATESVTVLYLKTGSRGAEVVGPKEVLKRYGVEPELVPDFIALRGDPSDGLPGAKGIGEKTAADLLRRFGSLENALAAWAGETPRVRTALREQAEELRTFKEIATLRHVDVKLPPDQPTDYAGGAEAARWLGMNRLAERLEGLTSQTGS